MFAISTGILSLEHLAITFAALKVFFISEFLISQFHFCYGIYMVSNCVKYYCIPCFPISGYFCVTGSIAYQPCPLGHYGNSTNLRRDTDCTPCPGGYYCDGIGLTTPTDVCDAGIVFRFYS